MACGKPGAFENYRYRGDLFPAHRFRVAYDQLKEHAGAMANKRYLTILQLAAREGETLVDGALKRLITTHMIITEAALEHEICSLREAATPVSHDVFVMPVDLSRYDTLLFPKKSFGHAREVSAWAHQRQNSTVSMTRPVGNLQRISKNFICRR